MDQRATPASKSTSAGIPKPTASTSGAAARTSSTASTKMSSVSCRSAPRHWRCTRWWTTSPSSTTPPRRFVPPASMPMTRRGGMAASYTTAGERPRGSPRLQGLPLPPPPARASCCGPRVTSRACASGGASAATASRASRARPAASPRAGCSSGSRSRSARWLLLSLLLFMLSAQIETGVSEETERALKGGGSLLSGSTILVLGSDERSDETAEPGSGGPGRADTIQLWRASFGAAAQAVDPARRRSRHPRPRPQEDQRRLRARRPGSDDRDRRGLPGQRGGDQPPDRGQLREPAEAGRHARRRDRDRPRAASARRRSATSRAA